MMLLPSKACRVLGRLSRGGQGAGLSRAVWNSGPKGCPGRQGQVPAGLACLPLSFKSKGKVRATDFCVWTRAQQGLAHLPALCTQAHLEAKPPEGW